MYTVFVMKFVYTHMFTEFKDNLQTPQIVQLVYILQHF